LSWPEWLIFIGTFIYVGLLKKNSVWAILVTIGISLLFLN
jgi:hypothetical protein